jgi:hypothetical protein
MSKSTKNKTWIGVGLTAIGLTYLFNRFSFKAKDNHNGTISVKVVDGIKTYKRDYSLNDGITDFIFGKYKLHMDPQPREKKVTIELYNIKNDKIIEQRVLFPKTLSRFNNIASLQGNYDPELPRWVNEIWYGKD